MNKANDNASQQENPYQSERPAKSSNSCCFYGCLFMFLFVVLVVVGGGLSGYWWIKGQVNRYTADAPADLPTVDLPEEELAEIQGRVDDFKEKIEAGETPEDLVLTADEINALITKNDDLKGRVYVTIENGEVSGDVSLPVDSLPGGKGRYFNASATFDVSLENGVLIVTLADAEVKGERIPQQYIDGISKENLAKDAYKDPEAAATLRRIESLSIEGDKIILKPRAVPSQTEGGEAAAAEDQSSAGTTSEVPPESPESSEPAGTDAESDDQPAPTAEPQ